jgi:Flp pilus assembly protein TadB
MPKQTPDQRVKEAQKKLRDLEAKMSKSKGAKIQYRLAIWMHNNNKRVNIGWNVYLSPYISMLYYLSLMEIVVAKLFPDLFTSSTALAVASYVAFLWLSYHLGKRYERLEALQNRLRRQRNPSK